VVRGFNVPDLTAGGGGGGITGVHAAFGGALPTPPPLSPPPPTCPAPLPTFVCAAFTAVASLLWSAGGAVARAGWRVVAGDAAAASGGAASLLRLTFDPASLERWDQASVQWALRYAYAAWAVAAVLRAALLWTDYGAANFRMLQRLSEVVDELHEASGAGSGGGAPPRGLGRGTPGAAYKEPRPRRTDADAGEAEEGAHASSRTTTGTGGNGGVKGGTGVGTSTAWEAVFGQRRAAEAAQTPSSSAVVLYSVLDVDGGARASARGGGRVGGGGGGRGRRSVAPGTRAAGRGRRRRGSVE